MSNPGYVGTKFFDQILGCVLRCVAILLVIYGTSQSFSAQRRARLWPKIPGPASQSFWEETISRLCMFGGACTT